MVYLRFQTVIRLGSGTVLPCVIHLFTLAAIVAAMSTFRVPSMQKRSMWTCLRPSSS